MTRRTVPGPRCQGEGRLDFLARGAVGTEGVPVAQADGYGAQRPEQRVVQGKPVLPPLLITHRAPDAFPAQETHRRQHLTPGQHGEHVQVLLTAEDLHHIHKRPRGRRGAVDGVTVVTPVVLLGEGANTAALGDERRDLAGDEAAHAQAMRVGQTRDVARQTLRPPRAHPDRRQVVQPRTRCDGRAAAFPGWKRIRYLTAHGGPRP